jgi:hypothetical protein
VYLLFLDQKGEYSGILEAIEHVFKVLENFKTWALPNLACKKSLNFLLKSTFSLNYQKLTGSKSLNPLP